MTSRNPIRVIIEPPANAPATWDDLTPEQQQRAAEALAIVLGTLARVDARAQVAA